MVALSTHVQDIEGSATFPIEQLQRVICTLLLTMQNVNQDNCCRHMSQAQLVDLIPQLDHPRWDIWVLHLV
eukprot:216877-Chlamydomonas_euryale.AAC.7